MQPSFASRMNVLRASDIREILKVTQNPDMISFAGGLPAPELFPNIAIGDIAHSILRTNARIALQYSPTEGYQPLREQIAQRMNMLWRTDLNAEEILITTGSQQGLDLIAKLFLDDGDAVACESPTYLGAVMAFNVFKPRWLEIPTDDTGMDLNVLETALRGERQIKMIYVVPNYQNPSGRTWSVERRQGVVELATRYNVPLIEDNPYGELAFEGVTPPAMQSMDNAGIVISLGTFSKIFCPGLRVGWVAARTQFLDKLVVIKQATDLHSSTLDQIITSTYLQTHDLEQDLAEKRTVYGRRRDAMVAALEAEMPPGVTVTHPRGGLFLWLELPEEIDARILLQTSLERGVAFVPGESFFPNSQRRNTMRLNFSNMPENRIREGVHRLTEAIKEMIVRSPLHAATSAPPLSGESEPAGIPQQGSGGAVSMPLNSGS
jgi:2-aminoadipate transaminase